MRVHDVMHERLLVNLGPRKHFPRIVVKYHRGRQHCLHCAANDREIVLAAVNNDGFSLISASEQLKNDREIVLAAVKRNGYALCHASEELKNDREVVLATGRGSLRDTCTWHLAPYPMHVACSHHGMVHSSRDPHVLLTRCQDRAWRRWSLGPSTRACASYALRKRAIARMLALYRGDGQGGLQMECTTGILRPYQGS